MAGRVEHQQITGTDERIEVPPRDELARLDEVAQSHLPFIPRDRVGYEQPVKAQTMFMQCVPEGEKAILCRSVVERATDEGQPFGTMDHYAMRHDRVHAPIGIERNAWLSRQLERHGHQWNI